MISAATGAVALVVAPLDLSGARLWDASSVDVLDAIEHEYAARGKAVEITGRLGGAE
jgi:hypothetical protein